MVSADSKFDDLSDADIDSLVDDANPKNAVARKQLREEYLFCKVANFNFFIQAW